MTLQITEDQLNGIPAETRATLSKFVGEDGTLNISDLAKSNLNGQQELTRLQQAAAAKKDDGLTIPDAPNSVGNLGLESALTAAGLTRDALAQASAAEGGIPAAVYQRLEQVGINRLNADMMAESHATRMALAQRTSQDAMSRAQQLAAGGREEATPGDALNGLRSWAASPESGYTPEQRASLNAQLENPATTDIAIESMMTRHQQQLRAGNAIPLNPAGLGPGAPSGIDVNAGNARDMVSVAMSSQSGAADARKAILEAMASGSLAAQVMSNQNI